MILEFTLLNEELNSKVKNKLSIIDDESLIATMLCIDPEIRYFLNKIDNTGKLHLEKKIDKGAQDRAFLKFILISHIQILSSNLIYRYSLYKSIEERDSHIILKINEHEFINRLTKSYLSFSEYYPKVQNISFKSRYASSLYMYILQHDYPTEISFGMDALKYMLQLHKDTSYRSFKLIEMKISPVIKEQFARHGIKISMKRFPEHYATKIIMKLDYTDSKI